MKGMKSIIHKTALVSLLISLTAATASAFIGTLVPTSSTNSKYFLHDNRGIRTVRSTPTHLLRLLLRRHSSNDDGYFDAESNIIQVALITSGNKNNEDTFYDIEALRKALQNHPFSTMTGIKLSVVDLPCFSTTATNFVPAATLSTMNQSSWSKENVAALQKTDIACFTTISSVKAYLQDLDKQLNSPTVISEEERRKLPNPLDMVVDIIGGITGEGARGGTAGSVAVGVMAACANSNTARECLNSGRWMANHIYYPKDGNAKPVPLKAEPHGDDNTMGNADKQTK